MYPSNVGSNHMAVDCSSYFTPHLWTCRKSCIMLAFGEIWPHRNWWFAHSVMICELMCAIRSFPDLPYAPRQCQKKSHSNELLSSLHMTPFAMQRQLHQACIEYIIAPYTQIVCTQCDAFGICVCNQRLPWPDIYTQAMVEAITQHWMALLTTHYTIYNVLRQLNQA